MTILCKIFDAIYNNDEDFMRNNSQKIKHMYENEDSSSSTCVCGCEETTTILDILCSQLDILTCEEGKMTDRQITIFKSVKFLVEEGIIDPNFMFTSPHSDDVVMSVCSEKEMLITKLLRLYTGWVYEYERIVYIFDKTSPKIMSDFRDEHGASIVHYIFYGFCRFDDTDVLRWFDVLDKNGFDWKCETYENKQGILVLAVENMSIPIIEYVLKKGLNPSSVWDKFRKCSNSLQYMLYIHRYEKNTDKLENIAKIAELLIKYGINLEHTDSDDRNIMDYLCKYCWDGTRVFNVIRDGTRISPKGYIRISN